MAAEDIEEQGRFNPPTVSVHSFRHSLLVATRNAPVCVDPIYKLVNKANSLREVSLAMVF
jgi:hypothetical protein